MNAIRHSAEPKAASPDDSQIRRVEEREIPIDAVVLAMTSHLSELNARSIVGRAMRSIGRDVLTSETIPALCAAMDRGLRLFTTPAELEEIDRRIRELGGRAPSRTARFEVRTEADVVAARLGARELCQELRQRPLVIQRVATIVSELARNIALYAFEGRVEIAREEGDRALVVVARDDGPGIADLELVLSGRYESETGMGRGLLGVRRLADAFDVQTSANGTVVRVEIRLDRAASASTRGRSRPAVP